MHILIPILILMVMAVVWWVLTLRLELARTARALGINEAAAKDERQMANEWHEKWKAAVSAHDDANREFAKENKAAREAHAGKVKVLELRVQEMAKSRDEAIGALTQQRNKFEREIEDLKGRLQGTDCNNKHKLEEAEKRIKAIYQRIPRFADAAQQNTLDKRRMAILATMSDEDPSWYVFMSLIDEHECNELEMGLKMGLSDGERQYHTGRAASARDLAMVLRDLRAQGQRMVEQRKAA